MEKFKIVRYFKNGRKRTVKRGLALAKAQQHCQDPQTDSEKATGSKARRYTQANGPWFDGYVKE